MNWCDLRPALSAATRCVLWEAEHPVRSEAYCELLKASALKNFWWDPGNYQVCGRNLTRKTYVEIVEDANFFAER